MADKTLRLIVIGTSAGGMQALCRLLKILSVDLEAAILIVQHISIDSSTSILVERLGQNTKLTCQVAKNGEEIKHGNLYMAPADRHLLVKNKELLVVRGPRENNFRPSIDPLFRSAAVYHGTNVIGLILTGFMSDGVLGMETIKRCGGTLVVQHPDDAEFPVLPQNIIRNMAPDYIAPIPEVATILNELTRQDKPFACVIPTDIWQEAQLAERVMTNSSMNNIDEMDKVGVRAPFSCPECGGGLWEFTQKGTIPRFRCHTGHAYSEDTLLMSISSHLEETLFVALRTLEERRNILLHMSHTESERGNNRWSEMQEERAGEMKVHIERLRELLSKSVLSDEKQMGETG